MPISELFERQTVLVRTNVAWLRQAAEVIGAISEDAFLARAHGHRAASHLRHIIEFYECLLEGLDCSHVDYDARRRDPSLESSRRAALARIGELIDRLEFEPALRGDGALFVRMEDASGINVPEPFLLSSIGRELQVLSSHTIHHFALIAVALEAHGYQMPEDFGVAPSTLRHRAQLAEVAA